MPIGRVCVAFRAQSRLKLSHPFSIIMSAAVFGSLASLSFDASKFAARGVSGFFSDLRWSITNPACSLSSTRSSSIRGVGFGVAATERSEVSSLIS